MWDEDEYKKNSDLFYSNYWTSGDNEPDYEMINQYLKQRYEARKASGGPDSWGELLRECVEEAKRKITLDPHEKLPEAELVSMNDYITMMGG